MTIRERLFEIPELNISQILMQMRDNQLYEYIHTLNSFVEDFPTLETQLKEALESKDYLAFSKTLADIRDKLRDIFADELSEECQKQINALVTVKHEKVQASMTYLLSLLAMLSIDIQVVIYMDENAGEGEPAWGVPEDDGEHEPGKMSILAVDDSSFSLDTLKTSLESSEYRFVGVTSGAAALKYLQNHDPDLFILDIEMPEIDGYELAGKIKELGKTAPILFLTGNATREYVLRALKSGAADFIVKPVTRKLILEKVEKFIKRSEI